MRAPVRISPDSNLLVRLRGYRIDRERYVRYFRTENVIKELFVESRGISVDLGVQETLAVDVAKHLTELLVESWFSPQGHRDRLTPMVSSLIYDGSKEIPLHQTHNLFIERESFVHMETHHASQIAYRSRLEQQVGWKVGNLLQVREQPELVTVY